MIVHLIDGTYELFRHFYGQRRFNDGNDKPLGAVVGVLHSVLEILETGQLHIGVATDHVIESFRNELWPDYKTGDFLALVGDAQDGYPGIRGIGKTTAAALLNRHGPIESFPPDLLRENRESALLFKVLATLRTDEPLFTDVNELKWAGPTPAFAQWVEKTSDPRLLARAATALAKTR